MAARSATVPLRSFKLAWVVPPERIPRDVLPPEGEPGEVEWQLQLEGGGAVILARFNARNYRHMVKAVDEQKGHVHLVLQGHLSSGPEGLYLEKAGFRVEAKFDRPSGGRPSGQGRPAPRGPQQPMPQVQAVRRLK